MSGHRWQRDGCIYAAGMAMSSVPSARRSEPERRSIALEQARVSRIITSLLELVQTDMPEGCDFERAGMIEDSPDWLWCRNEAHELQRCTRAIADSDQPTEATLADLADLDVRVRALAEHVEQTLERLGAARPATDDRDAAVATLEVACDRLRETMTAAAALSDQHADLAASMPSAEDCAGADPDLVTDAQDALRRAGLRADYLYGEALRALGTVIAAHAKAAIAPDGSYLCGQLQQDAENADSEVFHLTGVDLAGRPGTGDGTGRVDELRTMIVRAADAVQALRASLVTEI